MATDWAAKAGGIVMAEVITRQYVDIMGLTNAIAALAAEAYAAGQRDADELRFGIAYDQGRAAGVAEAVAIVERRVEHQVEIPCPDGKAGCLVYHYAPTTRRLTADEIAAALRASQE
jgi:hypothetical protein